MGSPVLSNHRNLLKHTIPAFDAELFTGIFSGDAAVEKSECATNDFGP